jgi:hypothetical protein
MKTDTQLKFEADLLRLEQEMDGIQRCLDNVRDEIIEEVAQHVEKMSPIVAGYLAMYIRNDLANYIRGMKQ